MRRWYAAIVVAVALAAGGRAQALTTLSFESVAVTAPDGKGPAGRVYCGGDAVLTLTGHGWNSVRDAGELARRLNALAHTGIAPETITLWHEPKARVIMAGGERLLVIDKVLARSQKTDVDSLARTWLKNLRLCLSKPYLAMEPIVVPLGETRATPMTGRAAGPVIVKVEPAVAVATAQWNQAQNSVAVTGTAVGQATLVLEDGANRLSVPIRVAKYAAQVAGPLTAVVTGNPASVDVIEAAVRAALDGALTVEPGATSQAGVWMAETRPLPAGGTASVPVVVSAEGADYLPYRVRPLVSVANQSVPLADTSLLLVSNSPERLRAVGLWYEAVLEGNQAARLLYHHVNSCPYSTVLAVELWNLSDQPARVHITPGAAGPSSDEAWVGHRATVQFLENRTRQSGWILTIPAATAVTVVSQPMPREAVASGLLELRTLGEAKVSVRLYLRRSEPIGPQPVDGYQPAPDLGHFQYPQPVREVSARYEVGGSWAFVTIGDKPAEGKLDGDRLAGSYGVLYDITLELSNPTGAPAEVLLETEAAGGPARGALLVDGRMVEAAMVKRTREAAVLRYGLAPGEARTVKVQTMPQAGSNYPIRLIARPSP